MDYCLKFESEAAANAVLYRQEGLVLDDAGAVINEGYRAGNYENIDVIGTIFKPTGRTNTTEDGFEYPDMAPIDGWHVNIRHSVEAPELDAYAVVPRNPVRVWA